MKRRNFIRGVLIATAGFSILPGAGRIWKAQRPLPSDYQCFLIPPTINHIDEELFLKLQREHWLTTIRRGEPPKVITQPRTRWEISWETVMIGGSRV